MNRIERFYATIERKPVDRPASWLGLPLPEACERLFSYFKSSDINQLKQSSKMTSTRWKSYESPHSNAIYTALNFADTPAL